MPDKKLAKTVLLIHSGLLVFGLISFKVSKHEFAVLVFVLKYFSLPAIVLSVVTMTFLFKITRQVDTSEKKEEHGLIERIKTWTGLTVIGVLIGVSYFLSFKSLIELTNRHIGQQITLKITGKIIEKSIIDNRKGKTFYLKVKDTTDKIIEIRVTEDRFEEYNKGDTFTQGGMKGSLGFIYTE
jgi:hypothetical protein